MNDEKHEPVRSVHEKRYPADGPDWYRPQQRDCFTTRHGLFLWYHTDLCRFHQMYYQQYVLTNEHINALVQKHKTELSEEPKDEGHEYFQAKLRDSILDQDMQLHSTRVFADQMLVIGLWAAVEQHVGRTLVDATEILTGKKKKQPYRWQDMCDQFAALGIDITACNSYADINECRVLNNKIKHDGGVDEELERFPSFTGQLDVGLDALKFDLQRYSDAVFEFVGNVLEITDAKCGPGTERRR
jgi:hypothetical protein